MLVVAVDGRSGSGKSTIVNLTASRLPAAAVIDGDEFYAGGSAATWDSLTAEEKVAGGIDWRRQRQVLEALTTTRSARWRAFDWDHDDWDSDTAPLVGDHRMVQVAADAQPTVVILDGAYSARPELSDLLDVRVLVQAPGPVRRSRIRQRDGADYEADWTARWAEAEELYFGAVVPSSEFDLVLVNDERIMGTGSNVC